MLKYLIINWNRERGLLDTFDPALELKMLSEEAREFHNAVTFEHKLVEYADFVFVKAGTLAKNHSQILDGTVDFFTDRNHFIQLMEWTEEVESNMIAILSGIYEELGAIVKQPFEELLKIALTIVIENNFLKGNDKKDGKVVKSDNQNKPEDKMKEILYGS